MRGNDRGVTVPELILIMMLLAIVASALTFTLSNVFSSARDSVSTADTNLVDRFYAQWDKPGYLIEEGAGEYDGYLLAYWDEDGDGLRDDGENEILARLKLGSVPPGQ